MENNIAINWTFLTVRLYLAIIFSLVTHVVLFYTCNFLMPIKILTQEYHQFILNVSLHNLANVNFLVKPIVKEPKIKFQPNQIDKNQVKKDLANIKVEEKTNLDSQVIYYATNQVAIQALPMTTLYVDSLKDVPSSGLPIKVRVYISRFGHVIKIEPLSVSELDSTVIIKLTEILEQTGYLPAKKDGLNVDSYQDLEFLINHAES